MTKKIHIGTTSHSDYLQLQDFMKQLRDEPLFKGSGLHNPSKLVEKLIVTGQNLDQLFSLGKSSGWSYYIVEDIFECYAFWMLGLSCLLRSEYGREQRLKIKYPSFAENDGVSGMMGAVFNMDMQVLSKGVRLGESYEDGSCIENEEGIAQLDSAHQSLKNKINSLSEVLKVQSVLEPSSSKIRVNIDIEKGIYRLTDDGPVRYPHIHCNSKIFMTIRYLMVNGSATLANLAKHNGQEQKSVKRGIKAFNQASRSRLSLPVDPIIGDGLYKLNKEYIDFI